MFKFRDINDNLMVINAKDVLSAVIEMDITTKKFSNVCIRFRYYNSNVTFKFKNEDDARKVIELIYDYY